MTTFKRNLKQILKYQHVTQQFQRQSQQTQPGTVDFFINGKSVTVPSYFTVMQALRRERITIPSFCYHDRLSIAGNCRMCLVEVEGWPKPQISCAIPVAKGMKVRTNSPATATAQEGVLEFLLINHPLDCPICDQGGECDLQDLSMRFGNDRTRYTDIHYSGKRAVENKDLSPLIRAEMTRCIHCTRCIRFASQVSGMDILGTTGRGADMHVGTYVDKMYLSEVSGNIIDLCPVGALTSIPYMFKARPWEVSRTNSIDVTDATGTNIVINHRQDRVLRILPREHEEINQEWLSDKGRWAIDSLEMQRLVTPMYRKQKSLYPLEWDCGLQVAADIIKAVHPEKIIAIAGPHCNVETLVAAKDFLNVLGCENTYIERNLCHVTSGVDLRAAYSLNINMKDISTADKILLVGTNPRFEAPILNTWIRQAYMFNECDIYSVGPSCEFNYHVNHLGDDLSFLPKAASLLKDAKKPMIFIGVSQLESCYASQITNEVMKIVSSLPVYENWEVFHVVTREASFAAALEAGWKPGAKEVIKLINPKVIISLGADEVFYTCCPDAETKVIYIGFQGDRGAELASVVLPGSAYTESGGIYLNMEGRSQFALPAVTPPGKARYDWKIIRALSEYCGVNLFYCDDESLRCRLCQISPNFTYLDQYQPKLFAKLLPSLVTSCGSGGGIIEVNMKTIKDYYCSEVFSNNSPTMVRAQRAAEYFKLSKYASI